MLRPFLADAGLTLADIGWLLGTVGFVAGLLGALVRRGAGEPRSAASGALRELRALQAAPSPATRSLADRRAPAARLLYAVSRGRALRRRHGHRRALHLHDGLVLDARRAPPTTRCRRAPS